MSKRRRKAVVAMSGGVDSSVAAALLVDAGYDVTGIMLKLWRGEEINHDSGCCNVGAAEDARRVADVLGIPFYVHNYAQRFADTVIRNFHADYLAGRTPNPCVRCNQWIKFGTLLERARALGADVLATGHYAQVRHRGIVRYTVGQRRGLGISLGAPVFVTALDAAGNTLTVGPRSALACRAATIAEVSFTDAPPPGRMPILVQYRAHGDVFPAHLTPSGKGEVRVDFDAPAEAVAPGQSAAFYSVDYPDELLGGGVIASTD